MTDQPSGTAQDALTTFRAAHRPKSIDVGGLRFDVWTGGADKGSPPLLILGGLGSAGEAAFARIVAAEQSRRAIAPSYPDDASSVDMLLGGLLRLLDVFEAPHFDVFAHGLGAGIGHALVRRAPQRVRRIAVSSFGVPTRAHLLRLRLAQQALRALPGGLVRGSAIRDALGALADVPERERHNLESIIEDLGARQTRDSVLTQFGLLVDLFVHADRYRMHEAIARADVLLIFSDDDKSFSRSEQEALVALYPGARVKRFARGGPLMNVTNKPAIDSAIMSFFDAPDAGDESRTIPMELDDLASEGMRERFRILSGARIRCEGCNMVLAAASFEVLDVRRLEGISDPSDEAAVVGLRCPHCNAYGACVVGFGPMASSEDQDVLLALNVDEWPKVHA